MIDVLLIMARRFPFLDEDVIRTLLGIPLWEIADLDQPSGKGDKKILKEVAQLLGLHEAAVLPKRANSGVCTVIGKPSWNSACRNRKHLGPTFDALAALVGDLVQSRYWSPSHG